MDLDRPETKDIVLVSTDGQRFTLPRICAVMSVIVKNALENDPNALDVPCSVKGDALKHVVEYLVHHEGKVPEKSPQAPLKTNDMKEALCDPWDAEFVNRLAPTRQPLYDVLMAANQLDIKPLLEICNCKVASLCRGLKPYQVKQNLDPSLPHTAGTDTTFGPDPSETKH